MSWKTISFRIRLVISHTYLFATDEDCRAFKIKGQKVQKIIASLFLWCSGSALASHARGPGFNSRAG